MTSRRGCAVSPKRHANTCAPIQRAPARCEADPVNNVCDFRPGGPSPGIPNRVTVRALTSPFGFAAPQRYWLCVSTTCCCSRRLSTVAESATNAEAMLTAPSLAAPWGRLATASARIAVPRQVVLSTVPAFMNPQNVRELSGLQRVPALSCFPRSALIQEVVCQMWPSLRF